MCCFERAHLAAGLAEDTDALGELAAGAEAGGEYVCGVCEQGFFAEQGQGQGQGGEQQYMPGL